MGLMKKIATELQMGNSVPGIGYLLVADTKSSEYVGLEDADVFTSGRIFRDSLSVDGIERPAHCSRRRMKPFVDSCECEWCNAVDEAWLKSQESSGCPMCNHDNPKYEDEYCCPTCTTCPD